MDAMRGMPFLFLLLLSSSAMAWNPFATEQLLEVPLSKAELQHVKVNAGWPKGDDHILIFEVSNGLKEPIQCGAANAELTTGQTVSKVFVPKFAIPPALTRNASMPVLKGTLKSYTLSCSCYKKKGAQECVNPLK
jgi:hypothetical protein